MEDPLNDPRHPRRPQHPDFWRLVSAVNYLDGEATEGDKEVTEIVGKFIDPESLLYMGEQRVLRALAAVPRQDLEKGGEEGYVNLLALVMSIWCDGFTIAYRTAMEERE